MPTRMFQRLRASRPRSAAILLAGVAAIAAGCYALRPQTTITSSNSEVSSQSRRIGTRYTPSAAEWASLTVEQVNAREFRSEHVTEGKIAVDEDRSTPVFSPYAGRVTKLLARPGESVTQGQPLFTIEAADTVGAQNDFIAATAAMNKARSQLNLAQLQDTRARDLFQGKAIAQKDVQQAQATLISAQNDLRSATTALEAARNRLKIFGLNEDAVTAFQDQGKINPETTIYAPIAGTVVQRKVGPGQYIGAGATEPSFVIGDLSRVWLNAYVRETEISEIEVGDEIAFTVLALRGRDLTAKVDYIATAIDPATRRLLVRASVPNPGGQLKPEMFASVTIYSSGDHPAVGVPRTALIYEGDQVRLWVAHDDKTIEMRQIKTGLVNGTQVEVVSGLVSGEKIVTRGSLFIDRAASGS